MSATRTETEEERKIREATAGLNVTVGARRDSESNVKFFVVEAAGRRMRITPQLVEMMPREHLDAVLAALVDGTNEVKLSDGRTVVLVFETSSEEGEVD